MATQQRQRKASKRLEDEVAARQPAWREQAPAKPRKRVRRKQTTTPGVPRKATGQGDSIPRPLTLPSRETWLVALRVSVLVLAAISVCVGLICLLRWPVLAVGRSSTQISGDQRITKEEIYRGSGIDGRNVLLLRADAIAGEVKKIPGVAKVDVHVRLPNQVIIDIREHAPLVAWTVMTTTVWFAADGSVVPQAGAAPPLNFTDQSQGRLDKDPSLHKLVLENLGAVHAARPGLTEFFYKDEPGLYYRAPEGWDVWLGENGPMSDKLALVDAAGQDIAKQGAKAKVIDVRQSERKALWW